MIRRTGVLERISRVERLPGLGRRSLARRCRAPCGRWLRASASFTYLTTLIVAGNASGQTFIDIGVGSSHICALDRDGAVACSVAAGATRFDAPSGIGPFVAITAGDAHSCGLDSQGVVTCWGDNDFGQLEVPLTERTVVQIDAGVNHTCAVTDALTAFCWGEGSAGQIQLPDAAGGDLVAVSAGYLHSCALRSSGEGLCWGAGANEFEPADEIVIPPGSGPFVAIEAGYNLSCGLTISGEIQCWGVSPGELEGTFTDLATGEFSVCGLRASGLVECAFDDTGDNDPGMLETVNDGFAMLSIESGIGFGGCGLGETGEVFCWGSLARLPLPPGSIETGTVAVPVDLRVSVYSDSLIELQWQNLDEPYERKGFEIFRNDERIALIANGNSYLDTEVAPVTQYSYRVRVVSFRGETGGFSESVSVNTADRGSFGAEPAYDVPPRPREPVAVRAAVREGDVVDLRWEQETGISGFGFELRRDGNFIGFTAGARFVDRSVTSGNRYHYDVIAVDRDGTIEGFRGIDVFVDFN